MLANYDREKLINSILFFISHTKYCGKTKLFKLLYFLDFEHFMQIGRSVTGLNYYAWQMGPVPKALDKEIDSPKADLAKKVSFRAVSQRGKKDFIKIEAKDEFSPKLFSKRELRILEKLAVEYKDSKAEKIIERTHLENLPWHQVYEIERRKKALIPYEYAFKKAEADLMAYIKKENDEVVSNYTA